MLWKENNRKKNIIIIGSIVLAILIGIIIFTIFRNKPIEDKDFTEYLKNNSTEIYELNKNTKIDLSTITLLNDKDIVLNNCKLIFVGNYAPSDYKIVIRNEKTNSTFDFKKVEFDLSNLNNSIFDLEDGTKIIYNKDNELIKVSKGDVWTTVMKNDSFDPTKENELTANEITSTENFIEKFNSDVTQFSVKKDMTLNLSDFNINKSIVINTAENKLILNGTLTATDSTEIRIEGNGKIDLSNLEVIYTNDEDIDIQKTIIHISINYKNIIGEPKLSDGLKFRITDDGNNVYVEYFHKSTASLKNVVYTGIKNCLEGKTTDTLCNLESGQVENSITVNLDNPNITSDIHFKFNENIKLILTGSVIFNGGAYRFEGTGNVDMTNLKINASSEVGKTKTNDIIWYEDGKINLQYNGNFDIVTNGKMKVLRYN
jgi:hypothetical protein